MKYFTGGDGLDLGNGVSFSVLHISPQALCRAGASGPREPHPAIAPAELMSRNVISPSLLSQYM